MKVWLNITDVKKIHTHSDRMVHHGWNRSLPPPLFLKCIFPKNHSLTLEFSLRQFKRTLVPQQVSVPWQPFLIPAPLRALQGSQPCLKGQPGHSSCWWPRQDLTNTGNTSPQALTRIQEQVGFFPGVQLLLSSYPVAIWELEKNTLKKLNFKLYLNVNFTTCIDCNSLG